MMVVIMRVRKSSGLETYSGEQVQYFWSEIFWFIFQIGYLLLRERNQPLNEKEAGNIFIQKSVIHERRDHCFRVKAMEEEDFRRCPMVTELGIYLPCVPARKILKPSHNAIVAVNGQVNNYHLLLAKTPCAQ
ncbi:hypothetical protein DdX_17179 [Ditylenchus destructor]|uniref:Uncharacterized protein n=1 Tax=Ditylenchus destructor TaxID=166010 RepID=A0AAD4MRW8_9BILA|nr:hypothetical protein DdX_17179 [Ditylenchus destructor]